ncbi:MAG: PEP-CTERM sorting domain-containing protein [Verrucomicrobiota bacterium]
MKSYHILFCAVSLVLAASAPAGLMNLNYAGSFGPTTTLGGIVLGDGTPFSFQAEFDSAAPIDPGMGMFQVSSLSFIINGTPYAASLPADQFVFFDYFIIEAGNPYNSFDAGLLGQGTWGDNNNNLMVFEFKVTTPDLIPVSHSGPVIPTASVFTENVGNYCQGSLSIALAGGAGVLVINDFGGLAVTASLTDFSAVPEPGNLLALSGLVGSAMFLRIRRKA